MEMMVEIKASVRSLGSCILASCDSCRSYGFGDNEYEAVLRLKSNINQMYGCIFPMDNINI